MDTSETVPASEFTRNFGRYRMRAQREAVAVSSHGQITGSSLSPQAVLALVRVYGKELGLKIQPHDLRRSCAKLCRSSGGELEQIQFLLGHRSVETTERYLGSRQRLVQAVNDHLGIEPQGGSS